MPCSHQHFSPQPRLHRASEDWWCLFGKIRKQCSLCSLSLRGNVGMAAGCRAACGSPAEFGPSGARPIIAYRHLRCEYACACRVNSGARGLGPARGPDISRIIKKVRARHQENLLRLQGSSDFQQVGRLAMQGSIDRACRRRSGRTNEVFTSRWQSVRSP